MWKASKMFIAFWVTSFFFFPIIFKVFPAMNTKTFMAAIGVVFCGYSLVTRRTADVPKNLIPLLMIAAAVSLFGVLSMTINNTNDDAYSGYLISALVWLSSAYIAAIFIKWAHGYISVELVCQYLIAICLMQCVSALLIDNYPGFQKIFDAYIDANQVFVKEVKRLYGFGASLDVAGMRFAAVLIMIVALAVKRSRYVPVGTTLVYVAYFIIIAVVGSMIARTTYVGIVLSFVYLLFAIDYTATVRKKTVLIVFLMFLMIIVAIGGSVWLYYTDPNFYHWIRFAFEGFFNLFEQGTYSVASTDQLMSMYVFPDNTKTWIIGDGYFSNPYWSDWTYTYIDQNIAGFYKGTDVGYLRFIFYFGILGLASFSAFMCKAADVCTRKCGEYDLLFMFILIANFIVWFKVASDLFLVFAIFICAVNMQEQSNYSNNHECVDWNS